jgi:predicted phosphodiesterase
MKIGILADIHEDLENLRRALAILQDQGADRLIVLGDVFELGHRLDATVELLDEAGAVGVWGNHDFGLCRDPHEDTRRRFSRRVLDFMAGLRPRLEVEGCLFTHVEPWLDPEKVEDLWYFEGPPETPEDLARSFDAVPHRVLFVGHLHRWLLGTPEGLRPWSGEGPVMLEAGSRYLVAVHAVCEGRCALFDTQTDRLVPFDVRRGG